ncbi:hypothetical protein VULLAG_LOCUS9899 [Vulpes lagopus]
MATDISLDLSARHRASDFRGSAAGPDASRAGTPRPAGDDFTEAEFCRGQKAADAASPASPAEGSPPRAGRRVRGVARHRVLSPPGLQLKSSPQG